MVEETLWHLVNNGGGRILLGLVSHLGFGIIWSPVVFGQTLPKSNLLLRFSHFVSLSGWILKDEGLLWGVGSVLVTFEFTREEGGGVFGSKGLGNRSNRDPGYDTKEHTKDTRYPDSTSRRYIHTAHPNVTSKRHIQHTQKAHPYSTLPRHIHTAHTDSTHRQYIHAAHPCSTPVRHAHTAHCED